MRSGDDTKLSRLADADKVREIADVVLVSLAGFLGTDIGKLFQFRRHVVVESRDRLGFPMQDVVQDLAEIAA